MGNGSHMAHGLDPDPYAIASVILSAIGTLASIGSYVDARRENVRRRLSEDREAQLQVMVIVEAIETNIKDIELYVGNLPRHIEAGQLSGDIVGKPFGLPFEFGSMPLVVNERQFKQMVDEHKKLSQSSHAVIVNAYKLIEVMWKSDLSLSNRTLTALRRLNAIANEVVSTRANYRDGLRLYLDLTVAARESCRMLKLDFFGQGTEPDNSGPGAR